MAAGAGQWLMDPVTRVVPLSHSLSNHPFFILATIMLSKLLKIPPENCIQFHLITVIIFLLGVHKRVIAASIITARAREVLCDFNMSCDDSGKLILKPRPTNIT